MVVPEQTLRRVGKCRQTKAKWLQSSPRPRSQPRNPQTRSSSLWLTDKTGFRLGLSPPSEQSPPTPPLDKQLWGLPDALPHLRGGEMVDLKKQLHSRRA